MRPVAAVLDLSVSHLALAVCRILYHAAVLWLLLDLWTWRGAAFARAPPAATWLLLAALLVNAALVLGVWAPVLQVVNLPLLRAVFAFCLDPYTVDSVIENFSVVFALAPAPRALALLPRRGGADPLAPVPRPFVLLLFTALALLYADGLSYKLGSEIWRRGSAVWLGAALPHFSTGLMPQWAEVRWLMAAATYAALAYEVLFPLILVRRLRGLWAALGLLVHAGSGMLIALPQFGLLMTGLIAFFVPFERLLPSLRGAARPLAPEPPAARGPAVAAYVLIAAMLAGQASLNLFPDRPPSLLHRALGLEQRTIFIDWHFVLPTPLIRLTAVVGDREVALPSFDAEGYPTIHDRYWKTLGFVMRASPRREAEDFLSRYARDWLRRSGLPAGQLRLHCRDARPTSLGLDFGQDDEQRRRPWRPCGALDLADEPGAR